MSFQPPTDRRDITALLRIMRDLRNPEGGCPWDLEQDYRSIAKYTIEEAYEVVDAIERDDLGDLQDELGDLLLQVVFHSQMAFEDGKFTFADVIQSICDKMVRRHPHVFVQDGSELAEGRDADGVLQAWEDIKAAERAEKGQDKTRILDDVPVGLPALVRAVKLQKRAARVGFDWPEAGQVLDKLSEEIGELTEARSHKGADAIEDEFGDILFTLANLSRHLKVDPEKALRRANAKFTQRFSAVEDSVDASGRGFDQHSLDELEGYWQRAKASD
ncbi:nucleoside triphosphate pyrophosphohydrolase [Aquisalinus flavus]|uniref:Nucleoside triphosphate pyrophosphohydrolase n=1 Tax=Aquisalinus flavus TaxID=1526572 RepID=A0A8J2Y5Z5_9PROT|nr:nucleoside triphosphate pyrophosphohydrolase [Aquisalinus flavus]MBD0427753.1 nucleoside triphosphate pyrophosphohydrolase [Aquisalinus flavus]UNE47527.1 nucleoside triphosphate pyrophosphohydrolase [Aquisalinus flavus]GGD03539.1 nucleoside triphosphate pyrophosphohydrolase [Aquisalinus flavus]